MSAAVAFGSVLLTLVALAFTVWRARAATRIRVGFDLARSVVAVVAIVVMAVITGVATRSELLACAVIGGGALGVAQGAALRVEAGEWGLMARRSPIGLVLWGAGIVVMQVGGVMTRTGAFRVGQTLAVFSAALGIGLLLGRRGPMAQSRARSGTVRAVAGTAAAMAVLALAGGAWLRSSEPANAQGELTAEELCELLPGSRDEAPGTSSAMVFELGVEEEGVIARCAHTSVLPYTGQLRTVWLTLFDSESGAQGAFLDYRAAIGEWAGSFSGGNACAERVSVGDEALQACVDGAGDYVVVRVGRFLITGDSANLGPEGTERTIDLMIDEVAETVANIEALGAQAPPETEASQPPAPTVSEPPTPTVSEPTEPSVVEPEPTVTASPSTPDQGPGVGAPSSAVEGGPGDDVTPGEAAASAVAGLVAAAAIGLITLGEAAAQIGGSGGIGSGGIGSGGIGSGGIGSGGNGGGRVGSGGGPRQGGPVVTAPPGPYVDPFDGRPLPVDPATGRVWWPWDGGSGHWVDPSEAPSLIAEWDRELESETAARVGRHDAQREQDWQDLRDRTHRSQEDEAARRAAEQARLDGFDRRVEAARAWMEEADAGSLDQLDRIVERAANQGFVTDEDLAQAASIADRARVWADTRRQWDAEDWIRITANRNAVLGVTAKGISMLIDPTKGLTSGFIWGVAESWDRGDDLATVVANGVFEGAVLRGGYAAGTWGPGRAALGSIGWGSLSGAATAAGEILLRGGTLQEAWEVAKAGFVLGGLGGVAEDAAAAGRPPPEVPTIRNQPGGGTHYDHPMSPRHVDPGDPRYRPPGTPAKQIHVPPTSPWDWSQPPPTFGEATAPGPGPLGAAEDAVSVPGGRLDDAVAGAGRSPVGGADAVVVERGPVDVDRPPRADVVAPEAGRWQAAPDEGLPPPVGSSADEVVMERIEPARFPRRPPPSFVPEEPPAAPVAPAADEPVGLDDSGFRVGKAPDGELPGWEPEVPDIPPVRPAPVEGVEVRDVPIEEVETRSTGLDADALPSRPAILDGVEIDMGWVERAPSPPDWVEEIDIGLPRTSGAVAPEPPVTASPPAPSSPAPSSPPTPSPPAAPGPPAPEPPAPAASVPRNQAVSDAVFRGDVDLPPGAADELELRGDELFSGTQHGGQGGWSAEALAREETFWRSDGTVIPGSDAVDVLPGRGQFNLSYNQRTGRATVHFGPGLTEGQKRQLLRPGGPVEQVVAKVRARVAEVPDGS